MIQRHEFIAAVESCIGTPVVHTGRTIGEGLDCGGVPWAAARACGLDLAPTRRYVRWPSGDELTAILGDFCDPSDIDSAHVLQVYVGREPRHVVVPVGNGYVVHAWGKHREVKRAILTDRVYAGWRIRGVA